MTNKPFTCIDLFCGCGGFTLGMQRAGFKVLAALDFNPQSVETLQANLADRHDDRFLPVEHALEVDLTKYEPAELASLINTSSVDVIVGGPPCQGFSTARQVDGANHGKRLKKHDARRHLYRDFLRFVEHFQPRIFVMENVLGIRSAAGGEYYTRVLHEARNLGRGQGRPGYRLQSQIEDAYRLGVPQKRRRQLFIGVRADIAGFFPSALWPAKRAIAGTNMGAVLADLPRLQAGGGTNRRPYDLNQRAVALKGDAKTVNYLKKVLEVTIASELTNHVARPHSARDLRDFKLLNEGENSATAMRERNVQFEFPYDKSSFKDRFTRQSRYASCSTIVAHLGKDGLMFIHPTQNRSLTPREAARIQSFPDWFEFPEARTHSFRMIGNAVPPLVGEAVGLAVQKFLDSRTILKISNSRALLPKSDIEAARILERIVSMTAKEIRALSSEEFCMAWNSVFFIYPGLHPDEFDNGEETEHFLPKYCLVSEVNPLVFTPRYTRSGWPVHLAPLHSEAIRRFKRNVMEEDQYYPSVAQTAGIDWRAANLSAENVPS